MQKTILTLLILTLITTTATAWDGICPICKSENRKSKVYQGMCTTTLLHCGNGYYDEDGRFHSPPECNTTTCDYRCSNGHAFHDGFRREISEENIVYPIHRLSDGYSGTNWVPVFEHYSSSPGARNGK